MKKLIKKKKKLEYRDAVNDSNIITPHFAF